MTRRTTILLVLAVALLLVVGSVLFRHGQTPSASSTAAPTTTMSRDVPGQAQREAPSPNDAAGDSTEEPTEASAVDAAMELAATPQTWLYLSDEELELAIRRVAVPSSADALVDDITAEVALARDALARSPGRIWWVVRPLAWRLDSFVGERAQVSVWTVSVLSAADVAMPQADWATTSLDLEWDGTTWRLVATRDTAGPTPQLGGRDEVWQPEPFDDALTGFTRVGVDPS